MVDVASALITVKAVTAVVRDAGRIDLTSQVIELQQTLLQLLNENTALTSKNADLRRQITELAEAAKLRKAFHFEHNAYWRGEGNDREGPFCSRCFDVEQKAVRLTINNSPKVGYCGNCKQGVRLDKSPDDPPPMRKTRHPGWSTNILDEY